MQTSLNSKFKLLELLRYPYVKNQMLQAWDAADEYLLEYLYSHISKENEYKPLIFNDSFGALTLSLSELNPDIVTDSIISEKGIMTNAVNNNIDLITINIVNSLTEFSKEYNLLIIKMPKTLDYLHYFLAKVRPHLHPNCKIIVAGMVKSLPKAVWQILTETLGETATSLAKKKARLIFVRLTNQSSSNNKTDFPTHFIQPQTDYKIFNHANVFSKQSLDIGTRFLLQNLPQLDNIKNIIDLGCGNGIVGLNLAKTYPNATVIFTDESYMAVASAKLTAEYNLPVITKHKFLVNNCLDGFASNSTDLIVCNPPFHHSHSIGLHIALQMFQQSFKTLKNSGYLVVIANRHLPYYSHLQRIFGKVENVAGNHKFSLYRMSKY